MHDGESPLALSRRGELDDPLVAELSRLQRHRGLRRPRLASSVGPALRGVLGLAAAGSESVLRQVVVEALLAAGASLDGDERLVFLSALGVRSDKHLLTERLSDVGLRIDRDVRTVRRRLADANVAAARVLRERSAAARNDPRASYGWNVCSMTSIVDLRSARHSFAVEATILSLHRLTLISDSLHLPVIGPDEHCPPEITALWGGGLEGLRRLGPQHWRYDIRPGRPIEGGERHAYGLTVLLPEGQRLAPHNIVVPLGACSEVRCRALFPVGRLPRRVQRIAGVPPASLFDGLSGPQSVLPAPEVAMRFTDPTPGLAYGFRWQ